MNLKHRDDVWNFIKSVIETMQSNNNFEALIPKDKSVIVTSEITDLSIVYTEKIGFGKYEFLEGKTDDTEVTLAMDSETYYKMQMGLVNPMSCMVNGSMKLTGIPFKLLKGQKVNDEFKRVYKEMMGSQNIENEVV